MTKIHKLLRDEDFERAVLMMRAGRACWPESECFGAQNAQPEDELMLMKEIYMADLEMGEFYFSFLPSTNS
jgi:timeless